ncbi:MAG: hypothetical protein KAW16_03970, partial [candidate division Zixibacteria bacterium]|nr:hypothetical protein [candidate division Zixibacteria bacterium]
SHSATSPESSVNSQKSSVNSKKTDKSVLAGQIDSMLVKNTNRKQIRTSGFQKNAKASFRTPKTLFQQWHH